MATAPPLADNLRRLLGLHALRATRDSRLIDGLSPQALSELQAGSRSPSLDTVSKLAAFFEISIDRLLNASFKDLLPVEIADQDRFDRVETKIHRSTTHKRAIKPASAEPAQRGSERQSR